MAGVAMHQVKWTTYVPTSSTEGLLEMADGPDLQSEEDVREALLFRLTR